MNNWQPIKDALLGSLKPNTVYKTKGGDEVMVYRVIDATAICSDGRNRSNLACDEGIVNSSLHSRKHDLDLTDHKTV